MGLFDLKNYLLIQKLLIMRYSLVIKDEKGKDLGKAVEKLFFMVGKNRIF